MIFSSFSFLIAFLPLTVFLFWILRGFRDGLWSRVFLIMASAVFFGYYRPSNLILLSFSVIANYHIAHRIQNTEGRASSKWLVFGLSVNLIFLGAFKYLDFLVSLCNLFTLAQLQLPNWPLLLGISFFTFSQCVLLVDCYQKSDRVGSFLDHSGFVFFFPYIVSGPIERSSKITKQLQRSDSFSSNSNLIALGVFIFVIGLSKKLFFGDSFAVISDAGYANLNSIGFFEGWVSSASYLLHLYFDFSGYSDMALGCACMFGVKIQQNFNAPFRATSISDFWRRWHISLSNIITSYLFTPIVRSFAKVTLFTSCLATIAAMTIAGLWHGPSANYVLFGLIHGFALAFNQIWRKFAKKYKLPTPLAVLLTLIFVNCSFVVFRSESVAASGEMLATMFGLKGFSFALSSLAPHLKLGFGMFLKPIFWGLVLVIFGIPSFDLEKRFSSDKYLAVTTALLLVFALLILNSSPAKKFVYFGF